MAPDVELTISRSRERKMTPNVRKITAIEILEAQSTIGLMRAARGSERLLMMIPRTRGIRIMTTRLAMTESGSASAPSRMKGTKNGVRITVIMVRMMDSDTARATLPPVNCATFAVDGAPAAMLMRSRPAASSGFMGMRMIRATAIRGTRMKFAKSESPRSRLLCSGATRSATVTMRPVRSMLARIKT